MERMVNYSWIPPKGRITSRADRPSDREWRQAYAEITTTDASRSPPRYAMYMPPFTGITCPVTYPEIFGSARAQTK